MSSHKPTAREEGVPKDTPFTREVKRLATLGKAPDIIAVRLGVKMSRVLAILKPG
jgi:hypothetical protein